MGQSQSVKYAYIGELDGNARTDDIDVEAEVYGAVANAVANTFDDLVDSIVVNIIC